MPEQTLCQPIELLYDGDCPLCQREVRFLQKRDAGRGRVAFVDIAAADYDPAQHAGIDYETAMGRTHAILPDGQIVRDLEVFRRIYRALGMGWIYAPTRWPLVGQLADGLYALWARWRLPLTGRPNLKTLAARSCRDRCSSERARL